jgi:hypothetical protein
VGIGEELDVALRVCFGCKICWMLRVGLDRVDAFRLMFGFIYCMP